MKIHGYEAKMVEDKDGGGFTMFCPNIKGGAIITGKTKEKCLEDFKEAMGLAVAVAKLMEFGRTRTFNYKNK